MHWNVAPDVLPGFAMLVRVYDRWLNNCHLQSHHIFSDSQWKAFDTIPHQPLLAKLKDLELGSTRLQDHLTCRNQAVIVGGETLDPLPVLSRVPQGSVLGPLLFLICINDRMQYYFHESIC